MERQHVVILVTVGVVVALGGSAICTWIGHLYGFMPLGTMLSIIWGVVIGREFGRSYWQWRRSQ